MARGHHREFSSGSELAECTRKHSARASVYANGGGGLVVFVFAAFVFPSTLEPHEVTELIVRSAPVFVVYLVLMLVAGNIWGRRRLLP